MNLINRQFDLTGKVALLTGASKGIGAAMARALAEAGASVVISSRKQDALDALAAEFRAAGLEATGIACHMGKPDAFPELVQKTLDTYGRIDVLINNAATNPVYAPIIDCDAGVFDQIMNVNVKGPLELSKLVYPHMKAVGGGSIINISSIGGVSPIPNLGLYSVSKTALIQVTKACAKEWGAVGIRVNAVCPGLIKTKFSEALWKDERTLKHVTANLAIKRAGETHELMGVALWLASDAGSYATGGVYMVDGGETI